MREHIIDIKAESFPWQAKLMGVLFLLGSLVIITDYWWLSIIFAALGLVLLSGYAGTEIDVHSKTFREYNSYLFVRTGEREKFNDIEKIYINENNMSQKVYTAHTLDSSTFRFLIYNAYLKFDDGKKVFLTSRKDKVKLLKLLNPIVATLGVGLTDYTV